LQFSIKAYKSVFGHDILRLVLCNTSERSSMQTTFSNIFNQFFTKSTDGER